MTNDDNPDKIKSSLTQTDKDIPEKDVIFRTSENGKKYAINPETGETSGLGPDIDDDSKQAALRKEFDEKIRSGTLKKKINFKSAKEHQEGTEAYNERVKNGDNPSIVTIDEKEYKRVIENAIKYGRIIRMRNNSLRIIYEHDKEVGIWVSLTGERKPTKKCMVIFSKRGAHIVPSEKELWSYESDS